MSKRPEYEFAKDLSGKVYWRSLKELEPGSPEAAALDATRPAELPPGATEPPDGVSRRDFFNLMGAATAMYGLAACRRPEEKIVPFAQAPENMIPGKPVYYATATTFAGTAVGLLVESHDGRPTKIEGNPQHPESPGGGVAPWVQASILDMYDPDRSANPRQAGKDKTWAEAQAALKTLGTQLRAKQGRGFAVITEGHRSPTLAAALAALKQALPQAKVVRYEPFSRDPVQQGARIAFGKPLETVVDVAKAKVVVALDSDFLASEYSVVKNAFGFAQGRTPDNPADMNRLYAVESAHTVTGSSADHRVRLASRDVTTFAWALAAELAAAGIGLADIGNVAQGRAQALPEPARKAARAMARDLAANRGKGLVIAGLKQPAAVHALVHAMNFALENHGAGKPVRWVKAFDDAGEGPAGLVQLGSELAAGSIDTVLILGGNPVFNAPADAGFAGAIEGKTVVHLSNWVDETSAKATWHLNRAHDFESWSDVVAEDGTASIVQPLIAPLFDGKTDAEVVWMLLGQPQRAFDLVQATWRPALGLGFDGAWRKALHDGVIAGSTAAVAEVTVQTAQVVQGARPTAPPAGGLEMSFAPDTHAWDGRFANNAWLQEWPDPMTKLTWSNQVTVSPATAKKLNLENGHVVSLQSGEGLSARAVVVVQPGQADDSVTVSVGQGRSVTGRVGKGVGTDTWALRSSAAMGYVGDVKLTSLGGSADDIAVTQEHFSLEGRPHVREASLAQFQANPKFAQEMVKHPPLVSLWKDQKVDIIHKWGMAFDLGKCTGCGACQIACQAENNIPVVGKTGVQNSREMNWLRVDRYYEGTADDPRSVAQPMPCQQCENAPCEQVCPVAATTHSPDGLNDMAYNRCVGTRYCANNCPFKVRKFNFFNYTKDTPTLKQMQYNPDVTVRFRGVMEKCTYCVQRINEAKIDAKRAGTDAIADGAIKTACQQACPSQAISFGDMNDKSSQISAVAANPRNYVLLQELNVRPRTQYLARIRNVNPELETA
jgi:molybdopterin-containing oxidoreductase family iron-sulfur binding subunit